MTLGTPCLQPKTFLITIVVHNRRIMEQRYMLPNLSCCQYHAYWCPSELRSQGISSHGIEQIHRNIPSLASQQLKKTIDYHVASCGKLRFFFFIVQLDIYQMKDDNQLPSHVYCFSEFCSFIKLHLLPITLNNKVNGVKASADAVLTVKL